VPVTVIVSVAGVEVVPETVAATTNLNAVPEARAPVLLMTVPLSGIPLPSLSA